MLKIGKYVMFALTFDSFSNPQQKRPATDHSYGPNGMLFDGIKHSRLEFLAAKNLDGVEILLQ